MKKRKDTNTDLKLQIDRLFQKLRDEGIELSFQNLNPLIKKSYDTYKIPYVCTTCPKREFVTKEGELIEEGFKIYFQLFSEEQYVLFKNELFNHLKELVFIKFKNYKLTSDTPIYAGVITCKKLKPRESEEVGGVE